MSLLEVKGIKKIYKTRFGSNAVEALKNVNFSVEEGEYIAIMGESGSGKTTLLNILAALDKPTAGSVLLDGKELANIKESAVAQFRRDNLGFVFQEFNLLDNFTVEDNIFLPLVLAGKTYDEMHSRIVPIDSKATDELLRLFGEINRSGQTILMVTHSVKAASHASRVLFIKDGEVFHQIYRGESSDEQLYQKISDTLTMLATGGEQA